MNNFQKIIQQTPNIFLEKVKIIDYNFNIDYLEWNNLYCYDDINWIDFSNLTSSTFIISGKNGTGKSAIYDILVLAIWGNITIDKQDTLYIAEYASGISSIYYCEDIKSRNNLFTLKKLTTSPVIDGEISSINYDHSNKFLHFITNNKTCLILTVPNLR